MSTPDIIKTTQLQWVDASQKIKPTAIVLHWWQVPTWLGGIKILYWGLRRRKLSVQFAILKNGDIYQLVNDPTALCHHARCANESSIGIELQGFGAKDFDNQNDQYKSLINLVKFLIKEYEIPVAFKVEENPLRFHGISSHKIVDQYCHAKRLRKKKDVHDEYLQKVIKEVSFS